MNSNELREKSTETRRYKLNKSLGYLPNPLVAKSGGGAWWRGRNHCGSAIPAGLSSQTPQTQSMFTPQYSSIQPYTAPVEDSILSISTDESTQQQKGQQKQHRQLQKGVDISNSSTRIDKPENSAKKMTESTRPKQNREVVMNIPEYKLDKPECMHAEQLEAGPVTAQGGRARGGQPTVGPP